MNKYTAIGASAALTAAVGSYFSFSPPQLDAFYNKKDADWLSMPDGKMYHKSCIYYHDTEFKIENVSEDVQTLTKEMDGVLTTEELPRCEY